MSAEIMIMIITLGSASMSIVFLFSVLKENKPDKEKLTKILGEEIVQKVQNAKNDEEIKEIIKSLNKKQKRKLKTLTESQDIRVALNAFKEHLRGEEPIPID
jgi:(p)ppGpp synthase/HD superfamily hydrolase